MSLWWTVHVLCDTCKTARIEKRVKDTSFWMTNVGYFWLQRQGWTWKLVNAGCSYKIVYTCPKCQEKGA